MANQPKTPLRAFRVDDELWSRVKTTAARRGETATDVVRRALEAYVVDDDLERNQPPGGTPA